MPTGYTYPVVDGKVTEFKEFALQCARAFGALIMMRDDPMDAEIPEAFEPSSYSLDGLKAAKAEMVRLMSLSQEDIEKGCEREYDEALIAYEKTTETQATENERIYAMLDKVNEWMPPTPDHVELKKFMLEQLRTSISSYTPELPTKLTPENWLHKSVASANRNIEYHTKNYAEEVERTNKRNTWVKALRESLEQVPA